MWGICGSLFLKFLLLLSSSSTAPRRLGKAFFSYVFRSCLWVYLLLIDHQMDRSVQNNRLSVSCVQSVPAGQRDSADHTSQAQEHWKLQVCRPRPQRFPGHAEGLPPHSRYEKTLKLQLVTAKDPDFTSPHWHVAPLHPLLSLKQIFSAAASYCCFFWQSRCFQNLFGTKWNTPDAPRAGENAARRLSAEGLLKFNNELWTVQVKTNWTGAKISKATAESEMWQNCS